MTGRERVLAAFNHVEPDRTPLFEKLIKSPIADEILGRPCAASDFATQMQRLADGDWEGLQRQSAEDIIDLAEILGFDMVRLYTNSLPPAPEHRPRRINHNTWQFGSTLTEILPSGWLRSRPVDPQPPVPEEIQEARLIEALEAEPAEPAWEDRHFLMWRHAKEVMRSRGLDLAVFTQVYGIYVSSLPVPVLRWFPQHPERIHRFYHQRHIPALASCRRLIAEGAHVIGLGGDLASDLGPMLSPAHYREFIMPLIREQAGLCHSLGAFCSNASDGDLWSIADDFLLGTDVDGFEEIDFAAGMDLRRLKERYGERVTMIGNIDIRHTLTSGTPEQVRAHTRACLDAGLGNGGHVVMSSNCIHEGCRLDLFLEHIRAYREYWGLDPLDA